MNVELISVGTEILLGNIVNTNAAYLAEMCARLGMSCYYQSVVGDNDKRLEDTLKTAVERSDVVILTGGLGPTKDDLTKESAANLFQMELVEHKHTRKRIEQYMENYKKSHPDIEITANNWKQAVLPKGAIVLDNYNGTAPGLILEKEISEKENKTVILLPGPPNEMIPMFSEQVYPYLRDKMPEVIYSQMVKICGIGESMVEDKIQDLIEAQSNPTIAPYAKTGEVHLRITAKAENENEAKKLIKPVVRELKVRFGKNIYTTDENKTLEMAVAEILLDQQLTFATAESCTGGALSARMVNVPGISEAFKMGFVTYSNRAKRKYLLVKKGTLKNEGAVSAKTAREMAKGACAATGADVSVSITGIAGPDGGSKEKPVGLVYIACCYKKEITVKEFHFNGNRSKVREQSVVNALILLRDCVLENYKTEK